MDKGDAAFEAADPGGGVAAAVLDPVGVDFGEEEGGVGGVEEDVHCGLAAELFEFEGVIVIGPGNAAGAESAGGLGGFGGEGAVAGLGLVGSGHAAQGGVAAIERFVA